MNQTLYYRFKADKIGMFEALATLITSNNETVMKIAARFLEGLKAKDVKWKASILLNI